MVGDEYIPCTKFLLRIPHEKTCPKNHQCLQTIMNCGCCKESLRTPNHDVQSCPKRHKCCEVMIYVIERDLEDIQRMGEEANTYLVLGKEDRREARIKHDIVMPITPVDFTSLYDYRWELFRLKRMCRI